MTFDSLLGKHPAQVVRPNDVVLVTIDRYLTGQQLAEIGKYYNKKLPHAKVMVLQKGTTAEVVKTEQQALAHEAVLA